MWASNALRGILPLKARAAHPGLVGRTRPVLGRKRTAPALSASLRASTLRSVSISATSSTTPSLATLLGSTNPLRCTIKVTINLKNEPTPQALFSAKSAPPAFEGSLNTIPVMQRKQPLAAKLLRTIAGLQTKPKTVQRYTTEASTKPERRRRKLSRWLASVYGGDATEDALAKSSQAVNVAMACNLVCFLTKAAAFAYTGSASVFSEALHSMADLANQMLLAMGINRSKRGPSEKHPFGSGNERFVWGLASAVSLFFVGAGASIYHGIQALYEPPELISLNWAVYSILGSAVLEGISIWVAMEAVRQGAKDNAMSFWQYCLNGPDPMGVAVLLEDGAALAGLAIAGLCTALSIWLDSPIPDALGSILVGGLLGVAASFLINKNSSALLGQSMPSSKFNLIMDTLRNDHVVTQITAAKGIMIGADVATFSAEVDFDFKVFVQTYLEKHPASQLHAGIHTAEDVTALLNDFCHHIFTDLGVQINRLEEKIQSVVPEVQFVDIEVN